MSVHVPPKLTPRDDMRVAVWIENQTRYPTERLAVLLAQALARDAGGESALAAISVAGGAERMHGVPVLALGSARPEIIEGILRERREPYILFFAERGNQHDARPAFGVGTILRFTERARWVIEGRVERAGRETGAQRLHIGGELDADLSRAAEPLRRALGRLARTVARRRVGVALSGGGAWGFAHCALLRGLQERDIPVDIVAGASFGSVVGALYAARGLAGLDALVDAAPTIGRTLERCLVSSEPIERAVDELLDGQAFEDLETTFLPVAVDVIAAREVVITRGSVAAAVRASCAFPGMWGPVVREGTRYVDGSIVNNVPVSCLIDAGADLTIASSVMMPPAPHPPTPPPRSRVERWWAERSPAARMRDLRRGVRMLWYSMSQRQAADADVAFVPDLSAFRITDFAAAPRIVAHAATQLSPVLDAVGASVADPRSWADAARRQATRASRA